jgi:hypothetical protein
MHHRWKLGVVAVVGVAVAIPAVVMAGGGGAVTRLVGDAEFHQTDWTGKHAAPKDWTAVPGIGFALENRNEPNSATVSADMAKGRAKFRVRMSASGPTIKPGAALFAAKGSNSFGWAYEDACGQGIIPRLEWKRVRKAKAVAAKISITQIYSGPICL